MSRTEEFLLSGFGGQGVLFAGKFIAFKGLVDGKQVSWLPSYGPEMRGGTASCSVIVSDTQIGSPIIAHPDILIAMNLPSLDRYETAVKENGCVFYVSSLISRSLERNDVRGFAVPATRLAEENGFPKLANMILIGKALSVLGEFDPEGMGVVLKKFIPAKHADMLDVNFRALKLGVDYNA